MRNTTTDRNREMFAAFAAGQTLEQLGMAYHLTTGRVQAVLIAEKNRCLVSPDPYYRNIRSQFRKNWQDGLPRVQWR